MLTRMVLAAAVAFSLATHAQPNFVVIIGDDVGWDDIGAYGNNVVQTPNVDALAAEGLRFDYAFLTTSSCSPSRASIMTGQYPHETGAGELHQPLAESAITIPKLLKEAGYYTASVGKFHMGEIRSHFDLVESSKPSGAELWVQTLQNRPKDKPFFMWFAGIDAHRAWSATEGKHAIPKPHNPDDIEVPSVFPDTPKVRDDLAQYYDEVSRLDDYTGQVVAELKKQGVWDKTLLIFMSDNGRPFPRCKTTLFDDGVKTPFIVTWPETIKPGTVTESLVSAVDIAPTVLQLAGVDLPETFQGTSFAPILESPDATTREHIFAEHNWHDYQAHERSVRSRDFLYLVNAFPELPATPPADAMRGPTMREMCRLRDEGELTPLQLDIFTAPRPAEALYDLREDPHALTNVIDDPAHADILAWLRAAHRDWLEETNDAAPANPTPDMYDRETGERLTEEERKK